MDYGKLIQDAWAATWRYRFLWILGLFAGGTAHLSLGSRGSNGGMPWRTDADQLGQLSPEAAGAIQQAIAWASANLGLIAGVVAVLLLLGLAVVVVSLIAQGAMAQATVELARGQPTTLSRAWRAGQRLFWRYVRLWLMLVGAAILVAITIGITVAIAIGISRLINLATPYGPAALGAGVLFGSTVLALVLVPVAVGASIVVVYAQRAIAIEDVGAIDALRDGWRLLRDHPGASLLVWLINLALAIVTGIGILLGVLLLAAPLAAVGFVLGTSIGWSAATLSYIGLGALLVLAVALTLWAIANTFFWNYWTLAYLRLRDTAAA